MSHQLFRFSPVFRSGINWDCDFATSTWRSLCTGAQWEGIKKGQHSKSRLHLAHINEKKSLDDCKWELISLFSSRDSCGFVWALFVCEKGQKLDFNIIRSCFNMFLTCFAIVATYKRINNCRTFRNRPDTGWMWYGGGRLSSWIVITVECQKCRYVECERNWYWSVSTSFCIPENPIVCCAVWRRWFSQEF